MAAEVVWAAEVVTSGWLRWLHMEAAEGRTWWVAEWSQVEGNRGGREWKAAEAVRSGGRNVAEYQAQVEAKAAMLN